MPPRVSRAATRPTGRARPADEPSQENPWDLIDSVRLLLYGQSGTGKCLAEGTPVLMYDGSTKSVELVEIGDLLMGPDSKPRKVLSTCRGVGPLYKVVPTKGDSWTCNDEHVLTLTGCKNSVAGTVRDVSVSQYLREHEERTPNYDSWLLLRSTGVDFQEVQHLPVPPYLLGLWMGDGSVGTSSITNSNRGVHDYCKEAAAQMGLLCTISPDRNTFRIRITAGVGGRGSDAARDDRGRYQPGDCENKLLGFLNSRCTTGATKCIPTNYLLSSRESRRQLLAGILDTDGENTGLSNTVVGVTGEAYRDGLLFLCRSLGLAAYCVRTKVHACVSGKVSIYYAISISGDLDKLPTRVKKYASRTSPKRVNVTGFELEPQGEGDYFGFTLTGDGRFLLGDFTVTHNTTCWSSFPDPILALVCSGGRKPGELRSINTPENRERITPRVVTATDQLKSLLEDEAPGYATVVLDHVSGLEDLVLKQLLGLDELPAQRSWGLASQQQYGQCAQQCKEYLRVMLNLPGNVVIVGQERVFKGKDDGTTDDVIRPTVGVGVMPSLAGWLMPACDYVVQAFKRQNTSVETRVVNGREITTERRERGIGYCLRTGPHDVYCTKFRVPKGRPLPDHVTLGPEDSAYAAIMSLIQGEP